MDHRHGGGHVRWMVEYLRREVAPMLNGAYTDQVGRGVCAAGVLSRRAGMMAYDRAGTPPPTVPSPRPSSSLAPPGTTPSPPMC